MDAALAYLSKDCKNGRMSIPANHSPIVVGGRSFDLAHLNRFAALIPNKGTKDGTDLGVIVVFSSHVFTKRTVFGRLHDTVDHNGSKRTFDSDRYGMSKNLRKIITDALMSDVLTFISKSYGKTENLILIELKNGETWYIVYCFEPIRHGVRMEVLSTHQKDITQRKISRKRISYFARACAFNDQRIPQMKRPSRS